MKQNMKKILLVLCMAVCFFALSACSGNKAAEEPIPKDFKTALEESSVRILEEYNSSDEPALEFKLRRAQAQKDMVEEAAIVSWQGSKPDLGELRSIDSTTVERISEDSYQVTVHASFEKRGLTLVMSAEEIFGSDGMITLDWTEIVFSPDFTMGEKMTRAGLNTLMGMGTVFLVLIFISFIISGFKYINKFEAGLKAKQAAKEAAAQAPAESAPAVSAAPVPAAVPSAPAPAAEPVLAAPVPADEDENLADDLELVAVITAAISTASSIPVEGLVVRSIRRKSGAKWKNA